MLNQKNIKANTAIYLASIIAFGLFFRLAFSFRGVYNWDESTYILMGQSVLEGNLPYTELWEVKPPLTFYLYGGAIALFGDSLFSIRLLGAIFVIASAVTIFYICRSLWNAGTGFIAALLFIALTGALMDGRGTMTEHLAILPTLLALLLSLHKPFSPSKFRYFAIGILIACACAIRLNLAYLALIFGIFLLIQAFLKIRENNWYYLHNVIFYTTGFISVFFLISLPYLFTANFSLLWNSAIMAPLDYSRSGMSPIMVFEAQILNVWGVLVIIALIQLGFALRSQDSFYKYQLVVGTLFFIAIEWSMLSSGRTFNHYMLQIAPFLAISIAHLFKQMFALNRIITYSFLIAVLIAISLPSISEYRLLQSRMSAGEGIFYGTEYTLANFFQSETLEPSSLYLTSHHLAYWLLDLKPPTKVVTHPSNLTKQYLLRNIRNPNHTPEAELNKIFATQPEYIVKPSNLWYLNAEMTNLLQEKLNANYKKVETVEGLTVYRLVS